MALAHETVKATLEQDGEGWGRLFAEPNFVVAHSKYLGIEIYVKGLEPHRHPRVLQSSRRQAESGRAGSAAARHPGLLGARLVSGG